MEKIFNMDINYFDSPEVNPIYIAFNYLINADYEKNSVNSVYYHKTVNKENLLLFITKLYINNYARFIDNRNPSKLFEDLYFQYTTNKNIDTVITTLYTELDEEHIATYKDSLKPIVIDAIKRIKANDNYFQETKITELLDSNPKALFSGGTNFPDYFREGLLKQHEDKDFYFYIDTFRDTVNSEQIKIQKGKVHFICARPSGGKTTALISLSVECLMKGKNVIFITTEETPEDLFLKMINCYCYKNYYQPTWKEIIGYDKQKFLEEQIYLFLSGKKTTCSNENAAILEGIQTAIKESYTKIATYCAEGKLLFSDTAQHSSFNDLLTVIKKAGEGGVVMLDYIQHLPKMPVDKRNLILSSRLDQLRESSRQITEVVRDNNIILFAGAQLKRESKKDSRIYTTMEDLRESSDFEQDAAFIIGIQKNGLDYTYNIMKYRNNAYDETKLASLTGDYGYSYIKPELNAKGEVFLKIKEENPNPEKGNNRDNNKGSFI